MAIRRGDAIIEKAYKAFVSKKVLRIKAWSPVHLKEAVAPDHHGRRLAEELLGGGEQVEVATELARLGEEAGGRFDFEAEKAGEGVANSLT